jgi:hypothetical protein
MNKKKMELTNIETNQIQILTPEKFALMIEERVVNGLSYIEAIIEFVQLYDVEYSVIKKLISHNISTSLMDEAISLNMIKGTKRKKTRSLM